MDKENTVKTGVSVEDALFKAIEEDDFETFKKILESGVDPDVEDDNGATPLIRVAAAGGIHAVSMTSLLLEKGADVNAADSTGEHAYDLADANDDSDLSDFLLEHGAMDPASYHFSREEALCEAAAEGDVIKIHYLLKKGIKDIDTPWESSSEESALMAAVINGHHEAARVLIKAGADVDFQCFGKNQNTCLMEAVESDDMDMVKLLVEAGASLDLENEEGNTAYAIAKVNDPKGSIAKYLKEQNDEDDDGDLDEDDDYEL